MKTKMNNKKNKNKNMSEKNSIRRVGTITKIHGSFYEVEDDESGIKILATLSGKMRMNSIRLSLGDKVEVEVSEYDVQKGRIVFRQR